MGRKNIAWSKILNHLRFPRRLGSRSSAKGQALVEFTLVFILLLIIAWIPADFGLAFYTGQMALNASREGARIGAADPNLLAQTGSCTMPCSGAPAGSILAETAERLSSALLPGAQVSVTYPVAGGSVCNQQIQVQVSGNYNFFFYRLLRLLVGNAVVPNNFVNIARSTQMRWEHQIPCLIGS
jgi:Flp pilus assembly protein TadG